MNSITDKQTIARNFSRYAHFYDCYADVQRIAASALLDEIKEDKFDNILELGCGTGNYTLALREKFKKAKLKAVDISQAMIEVAVKKTQGKNIEFITADAEGLELNERFCLITSNACFQWFDDLEQALKKLSVMLGEKSIILFSIFGPLTFQELNTALKHALKDESVAAESFIKKEEIEGILRKNFKEFKVKEFIREEYFPGLKELLLKIKYSGIKGNGLSKKNYFNKQSLKEIEEIYLNKFKQIKATYQIFLCKAWR